MYSYVSQVAGCGSDVPFIEMTLTQTRKWDSNPEPLSNPEPISINMVSLHQTTKF